MSQIEVGYDKKFLKEKRKFKSKCPSIDKDFKKFEIALKIRIQDNEFTVPVDNKQIFQISGLDKSVFLPAFVVKSFFSQRRLYALAIVLSSSAP